MLLAPLIKLDLRADKAVHLMCLIIFAICDDK
jgi:hypothetical protein